MYDLFLKRMGINNNSSSRQLFNNSNLLMDKLFDRDIGYKQGTLYDVDGQYLEDLDFKYQYHMMYSLSKDQVDFYVQFRPYYHPEKKYKQDDGIERFGFFLDIPDDLDVKEKWLILGRTETLTFTRYNVLRCNWTFNWIHNGEIQHELGCIRNRNNYNSGVWSDGFVTSVENQIQFIVPCNDKTKTIGYDTRFMLSDTLIYPRVYEVSKIEDTFPPGVIKITLVQTHYNAAIDEPLLALCGYHEHAILPEEEDTHVSLNAKLTFSGTKPILHKGGSARRVTATVYDDEGAVVEITPTWTFMLNGEVVSYTDLTDFVITFADDQKSFSIKALYSATVGDVLTVETGTPEMDYYDSMKLEVTA